MKKIDGKRHDSDWLEDEQFKKFLHEYIEEPACHTNQDDNLTIPVTYRTLYKIYVTILNAKVKTQKFKDNLDKIDQSIDMIEKGVASLGNLMQEQDRINRSMRITTIIFTIIVICCLISSICLVI